MRRALLLAAVLASLLASTVASPAVAAPLTLGPAVSPRGPGRVSVVWEAGDRAPMSLALTGPDGEHRVVASAASARGLHRVELAGLAPGREYRYVVGEREARFIAPPQGDQEVHFAVFGDARSGDGVHEAIVARVAAERPDFALVTGDVVPDGDDIATWRRFFRIEAPLLRSTPLLTARGNHDGHDALVDEMLALGSDTAGAGPTYGSVDLGPVHVALVDTETALGPGSAQYAFLARDLATHRDRPLVVVLHKPLFSTGRHGGTPEVHAALGPLFQREGVDVVFQGHDHHYERTEPINGVTYVVTGGAGAPLFGAAGGPWTAVKESVNHYLLVDASRTRIRVTAHRLDGSLLDSFELDPRRNDNREFAAQAASLPAPGGGGCAMLLFGRERGGNAPSAGPPLRAELSGMLGTYGPVLGLALVRTGARRRRRQKRARDTFTPR